MTNTAFTAFDLTDAARAFVRGAADGMVRDIDHGDISYAKCRDTYDRVTHFQREMARLRQIRDAEILATLDRCIALNAARIDTAIQQFAAAE